MNLKPLAAVAETIAHSLEGDARGVEHVDPRTGKSIAQQVEAPRGDPALMQPPPAPAAPIAQAAPTPAAPAAPMAPQPVGAQLPPETEALVAATAKSLGVPLQEARAIVWNESRGNLGIGKGDGGSAWGPMQLHRGAAIDAGIDPAMRNADPETNVRVGLTYYKQLRDHFGNPEDAIRAYNRGPGMMQRIKNGTAPAEEIAKADAYWKNAETILGPSKAAYRPAVDGEALVKDLRARRSADGTVDIEGTPQAFNFGRINTSEDIHNVLRVAGKAAMAKVDELIAPGVESHAELYAKSVARLDDELGLGGPEKVVAALSSHAETMQQQLELVLGARVQNASLARALEQIGKREAMGGMTEMDKANAVRYAQLIIDTQTALKTVTKGAARTTSAGRIVTHDALSGEALDPQMVLKALKSSGVSDESVRGILEVARLTNGDPKAVAKAAQKLRSTDGLAQEWWINSILSGLRTNMVNTTSNALKMLSMPMERALGGVLTGNMSAVKDAYRQYAGMFLATRESLRYMKMAFKTGENVLDPAHMVQEFYSETPIGNGLNWFRRNVVRFPSRMLLTEDEFFKQMNYRASAYAEILGEADRKFATLADARAAGFSSIQEARAAYTADQFNAAFDAQGKGTRASALNFSREATFTQDLEYGVGKSLQNLTAAHPMLRFMLPFVRTPTNIIRDFTAHTPGLNLLNRKARADLLAGGIRRQHAIGQVAMGTMLYTGTAMAFLNGRITGYGPSEPKMRKIWLQSNQPYSIVTYDENGKKVFTSFARMEPFGTILGIAADALDLSMHADQMGADQVSKAVITAIAHNVMDKSYLRGMTEILDALVDPEHKLDKTLENFVGSWVPAIAGDAGKVLAISDPVMREVHGVIDAVRARVPGLSDALPAKLDWLTGEPISYPDGFLVPGAMSPFAVKKPDSPHQDALDALGRLGYAFSEPARVIGEYELTPEQYNRYVELAANPPGRKPLLQRIDEVIKAYPGGVQAIPRNFAQYADKHPLVSKINAVIEDYRAKARKTLASKDPAVAQAMRADRQNVRSVRRGQFDALLELTQE